ncbi:hypothetical protein HK101_002512 [Irineochytrium annulatum]|nr:hypothetical protein HK101_002512 [Irineochytrium annulatum]
MEVEGHVRRTLTEIDRYQAAYEFLFQRRHDFLTALAAAMDWDLTFWNLDRGWHGSLVYKEGFAPRQYTAFGPLSPFLTIMAPRQDIDPDWWVGLCAAPTEEVVGAMGKVGAAPAPSGLTRRVWESAGLAAMQMLTRVVVYKTFEHILKGRLTMVCMAHPEILPDPNFAGLPGGSTVEPMFIVCTLHEYARTREVPLFLLFNDIKKAFYTVSWDGMAACLRCIRIPEAHITMTGNMGRRMHAQVLTAFGPTAGFHPGSVIQQGAVSGPWRYLVLSAPSLAALSQHSTGFTLAATLPQTVAPPEGGECNKVQ